MESFEKYVRQMKLKDFGEIGQMKLKKASVVLAGVGGVGSAILPLLAGAGIGRIFIFDSDNVSLSNLHRQTLYTYDDIGKSKAECSADFACLRNPDCNVQYFCEPLCEKSAKDIFTPTTLCIDATDSFASRLDITLLCKKQKVRLISASASGFIAQNFLFGDNFYFDDIVDSSAKTEQTEGLAISPATAHISGILAANSAIKSIVYDDFQVGKFWSFDLMKMKFISGNLC